MIPFTVILLAQLILFASLTSAYVLSEKFQGNEEFKESKQIFMYSFLDYYMLMFGSNPVLSTVDGVEWCLLIGFTFLVNVLNLNLLISIIADTFEKVQS